MRWCDIDRHGVCGRSRQTEQGQRECERCNSHPGFVGQRGHDDEDGRAEDAPNRKGFAHRRYAVSPRDEPIAGPAAKQREGDAGHERQHREKARMHDRHVLLEREIPRQPCCEDVVDVEIAGTR